jgi:group I intron endonuclease
MDSSQQLGVSPTGNECGVYAIKNLRDGKVYIGSTAVSFGRRWSGHRSKLRKGKHANQHLQSAWNRDGEESFEFAILEVVTEQDALTAVEAQWIADTNCCDRRFGYNARVEPSSNKGMKMGPQSPEFIAKRTSGLKGRVVSEETRAKLRAAAAARPPVSDETRRKLSEMRKGRKNPWVSAVTASRNRTPEMREKVSAGLKRSHGCINEAQAKEIRETYAAGQLGQMDMARRYGVDVGTIRRCLRETDGSRQ